MKDMTILQNQKKWNDKISNKQFLKIKAPLNEIPIC